MGAAVELSDDFDRIVELPTRSITRARGEAHAKQLTPLLVTPRGRTHGMRGKKEVASPSALNWLQGYAIHEAHKMGGAYLQLPVGTGKTLLSFLFPYVFDAKRPVLVVPDALVEKTRLEFRILEKHWIKHEHPIRIVTLRQLTEDGNVDMLKKYKADLYILDEVDMLSNQNSSMAKRLARDIDERQVPCVCMTGTGGRFSILTFTHLIAWALKENAPVPLEVYEDGTREVEVWADALDEKTAGDFAKQNSRRVRPGVLHDLISFDESDDPDLYELTELGLARSVFRKRLTSTPGCIISDEDSCDKQLTIIHSHFKSDLKLEAAFKKFRRNILPDEEPITDSLTRWRQAKNLGKGYFDRWIDPPPEWWSLPKKRFFKTCEKIIRKTAWSENPLDTMRAVMREFGDSDAVQDWLAVKDEWKGETEEEWISGSVVDETAELALKSRSLFWTDSVPFGEALADATGLPFYGAKGLTKNGASIELDPGETSVILSTGANMRGRNLQDRWNENDVIGCVQSARYNEQLNGRTHRFGQEHDVIMRLRFTSGDSQYSFDRAMVEAHFVHQTQGHRQKILRAKRIPTKLPPGSRWITP